MAEDKIKLPRSSYEELAKIVKTYGTFDKPVTLDKVSGTVGMNKATISANSAFLTQIEVLEPGQKKVASMKGRQLANALEHEMPDKIRAAWRQVVAENDFLERIVAAVRIRKGMDESTLQAHIAYSAGEQKKPFVMTGARTVVDILRAAELIQEADGKFTVSTVEHPDDSREPSEVAETLPPASATIPTAAVRVSTPQGVQIHVNFQIQIDCSAGDLSTLGPKLREVIDGISSLEAPASEKNDQ